MEGLLEFKVLAVLRQKENFLKYKDQIKLELFKSPELQHLYKILVRYHNKYSVPVLSIKNYRMLMERSIAPEDWSNYIPLLRRIKKCNITDDEVVKDCIIKFAQGHAIRQIAQDLIYAIEHDPDALDLNELKGKLDGAIRLENHSDGIDLEYVSNDHDRLSIERDPIRIPTGLSRDLDLAIGGGLAQGELGIVLAPTGRGKTVTLINIGASALGLGKRIIHVTLEIRSRAVARRYDLRLTRRTFDELRENPAELQSTILSLKSKGSKLLIKDYSYMHCYTGQVEALLEYNRSRGTPVDLLIVDYADLLDYASKYKDKRHEVSAIYKELRIMAGAYNIPVWTASQGNRKSMDKRVVDMLDFAESIDKAFTADVTLTLSQTREEKEELMMRIFLAKQRSGSKNPVFPVICDTDRMLIKSYKRSQENGDDDSGSRPRTITDRSSPYRKGGGNNQTS